MRIVCAKCGEQFESLIVDRDLALKELEMASSKHIHKRHREVYEQVAKAIAVSSVAIARLLHMSECVVIPEEEGYILEKIDKSQELVMMAIGYDPEEDDEDEEDEDNLEPMLVSMEEEETEDDKAS